MRNYRWASVEDMSLVLSQPLARAPAFAHVVCHALVEEGVLLVVPLGAALASVEVVVQVGLLAEAAPAVWTHHLLSVVGHLGVTGQIPPTM